MASSRRLDQIIAPLQKLFQPDSPLQNLLPKGLSFEIESSPTGGDFTGNIVIEAPRTAPGFFQDVLKNFVSLASFNPSTIAGNIATQTISRGLASDITGPAGKIVGRVPMGFFDDLFGADDSPGDTFNGGLTGGAGFDWSNLLNTGVNVAGQFLSGGGGRSQGVPQTYQSNMSAVPMVIGAGGAVMRTGGALLAARLTSLGLTRSTAWTMLKKFGPASLVGLGLTSLEIAQVARSKGGHRRMNMCNGRALRRASRRLEGFHKFYKRTCALPIRQRKSSKRCK